VTPPAPYSWSSGLGFGVWDCRKVDVRLPGKENSNSYGARPVHRIITMTKWIRTSRLSIKISLSLTPDRCTLKQMASKELPTNTPPQSGGLVTCCLSLPPSLTLSLCPPSPTNPTTLKQIASKERSDAQDKVNADVQARPPSWALQGYLAHKKQPPPLGPPQGPGHFVTTGSWGGTVSYDRGIPVSLSWPGGQI